MRSAAPPSRSWRKATEGFVKGQKEQGRAERADRPTRATGKDKKDRKDGLSLLSPLLLSSLPVGPVALKSP